MKLFCILVFAILILLRLCRSDRIYLERTKRDATDSKNERIDDKNSTAEVTVAQSKCEKNDKCVGAYVNRTETNLADAAFDRNWTTVSVLLNGCAFPDQVNTLGLSPLHWAARDGKQKAVRELLAFGATVDLQDEHGRSPLNWMCGLYGLGSDDHLVVGQLLVDCGADVHHRDSNGWTALHNAAAKGFWKFGEFLLRNGADKDARSDQEWTPLMSASWFGQTDFIGRFLEYDPSLNARNKYGYTALSLATINGRNDTVKYLQKLGLTT